MKLVVFQKTGQPDMQPGVLTDRGRREHRRRGPGGQDAAIKDGAHHR
jgi:hypothetical protein